MPKRPINFIRKLKLAIIYLCDKDRDYGLVTECGICKSVKIKRFAHEDSGREYRADYKCLSCGAVGGCRERWKRGD